MPQSGLPAALRHFYLAEPLRAFSRERDFGVHWQDDEGTLHRVAWIEATRELYLSRSGEDAAVRVLAAGVAEDDAERVLAGWEDAAGDLSWLLAAVAPLAAGRAEAA